MDDLGISPWTSYIFLGLSLSIGLLVYILLRDAGRRKKQREQQERRQAEELLKEFSRLKKEEIRRAEKSSTGLPSDEDDQARAGSQPGGDE